MVLRYGSERRLMAERQVAIRYRRPDGSLAKRSFTTHASRHGPIVRAPATNGSPIAMLNRPIEQLEQSWLRTKASDYASFIKVAYLRANASNDTLFADDQGEIAFLMPQFVPRRDDRFDYRKAVNGADPATDWKGLHTLDELPRVVNPPNGWAMNTNDGPWWAAGPNSPKRADYPGYMDTFGQNWRGVHALRLLTGSSGWTLEGLRAAAFDPALPGFDQYLPSLLAAFDALPPEDPLKVKLAPPIAALRAWDHRWSAESIATTLACLWGDDLRIPSKENGSETKGLAGIVAASPRQKLLALARVVDRLTGDFGDWRVRWGDFNRFQRLTDDLEPVFDDGKPSLAVPFTASRWGSLAAFAAKRYPGTKRYYGNGGNSFVAVVEFGPRVRAIAVTAGGESGHPGDPHFADQAERYASGALREVYFYPDQLAGHVERVYHPMTSAGKSSR